MMESKLATRGGNVKFKPIEVAHLVAYIKSILIPMDTNYRKHDQIASLREI